LYESGASPLSGTYLVRNAVLRAALTVRDAYWKTTRGGSVAEIPRNPGRILLAVGGQLGDAVIATSAIHQLNCLFPRAEIAVLCPSGVASVFKGHPAVARIHSVGHWFWGHRGAKTTDLLRRWCVTQVQRSQAMRDIEKSAYEVAIDLYPFFPTSASLLATARIPVRVGYTSGGGGPLLTHPVPWRDTRLPVAKQHTALMGACWPEIAMIPEQYALPPLTPTVEQRGRDLLVANGVRGRFAVLHPGTSAATKRWPPDRWTALAAQLQRSAAISETTLVFTGHGEADATSIETIRGGVANTVSLCDQTDWQAFRWVIENAAFVVTADSVTGHVAGAAGVPTVVVTAGMSDPLHWKPLGHKVEQLMAPVPCAPCFLGNGCATMRCVRDVTVAGVIDALARVSAVVD
jgi:heptosyltransferase-2